MARAPKSERLCGNQKGSFNQEATARENGDVMPHKVGWLVRGPCANSAGASKPPQPAAGVDFFLFRRSRVLFVDFLLSICTGLGWAVWVSSFERQEARSKLQQARPGGRSGRA